MKIAIIGYGKMGKMVEKAALEANHEVVALIDPDRFSNTICIGTIAAADVCVDFTTPAAVLDNIKQIASLGKNLVVGTTGWYDNIDVVRGLVETHGIGLFYSANFSIGMNLFLKIVQEASKRILPTNLYDIAGIEAHHKQKIDSPSGTAQTIIKSVENSIKTSITVPFTSIRCGSMPGTHTLLFDSEEDTISLTHTARSRQGFAKGVITALEWMQKRKGLYTMEDLLFGGSTC